MWRTCGLSNGFRKLVCLSVCPIKSLHGHLPTNFFRIGYAHAARNRSKPSRRRSSWSKSYVFGCLVCGIIRVDFQHPNRGDGVELCFERSAAQQWQRLSYILPSFISPLLPPVFPPYFPLSRRSSWSKPDPGALCVELSELTYSIPKGVTSRPRPAGKLFATLFSSGICKMNHILLPFYER